MSTNNSHHQFPFEAIQTEPGFIQNVRNSKYPALFFNFCLNTPATDETLPCVFCHFRRHKDRQTDKDACLPKKVVGEKLPTKICIPKRQHPDSFLSQYYFCTKHTSDKQRNQQSKQRCTLTQRQQQQENSSSLHDGSCRSTRTRQNDKNKDSTQGSGLHSLHTTVASQSKRLSAYTGRTPSGSLRRTDMLREYMCTLKI